MSIPCQQVRNLLQCRRPRFDFWARKFPWKRERLPTPVFLGFPGGSDGKEYTCSTGDLGLIPGWEDPLEEGMATHSSILAWRIPWTEEPGGLWSMWSQRVGHDWVTKHTGSVCLNNQLVIVLSRVWTPLLHLLAEVYGCELVCTFKSSGS